MDNALTHTQGFGTQTQQLATVDPNAQAMAAQAKALVEARYIMAMHRPRQMDDVRTQLLKECKRPAFARNKSTYYIKPGAANAKGLGIRFVEVALRCMTNVLIETTTTHDDDEKELINVMVTDLETNISYTQAVKVIKTVERSRPMDDGSFISVRKNSQGRETYTVPANEDDLLNKRGALVSKAVRTLGLRIIPGDLQDEAEEQILSTRQNRDAEDPEAHRKKMVDSFSYLNVSAAMLEDFLEQPLGTITPAQIDQLRKIRNALRDGKTTWKIILERKAEGLPPVEEEDTPPSGMDPETGEVSGPAASEPEPQATPAPQEAANKGPGLSFDDVALMIKNATDTEELDGVLDIIKDMPLGAQEELAKMEQEQRDSMGDPA